MGSSRSRKWAQNAQTIENIVIGTAIWVCTVVWEPWGFGKVLHRESLSWIFKGVAGFCHADQGGNNSAVRGNQHEKVWKGIWYFWIISENPVRFEGGDENGLEWNVCTSFYCLWWAMEGSEPSCRWNESTGPKMGLLCREMWWNQSCPSFFLPFYRGMQTQQLEAWTLIPFEPPVSPSTMTGTYIWKPRAISVCILVCTSTAFAKETEQLLSSRCHFWSSNFGAK